MPLNESYRFAGKHGVEILVFLHGDVAAQNSFCARPGQAKVGARVEAEELVENARQGMEPLAVSKVSLADHARGVAGGFEPLGERGFAEGEPGTGIGPASRVPD